MCREERSTHDRRSRRDRLPRSVLHNHKVDTENSEDDSARAGQPVRNPKCASIDHGRSDRGYSERRHHQHLCPADVHNGEQGRNTQASTDGSCSGAALFQVIHRRLSWRGVEHGYPRALHGITAAELVLAREQRLSALDGLAAAAAHELGTPLATIALVAKELKRELPVEGPHTEDIDLLISQTGRCREILSRLANRDTQADDMYARVKLSVMIEDLVSPIRGPDVTIDITVSGDGAAAQTPEPVFRRNPAIAYGLANLLENAVDFAQTKVSIVAQWSQARVSLLISDDGPGFDQGIFDRLGDPFVTTRPGYGVDQESEKGRHEGMGLGFFIAKTLLERSGATVSLANRPLPEHGAIIQLSWPRSAVDLGFPLGGVQGRS